MWAWERSVISFSAGRVSLCFWFVLSKYVQTQGAKRDLGVCSVKVGRSGALPRLYNMGVTETVDHLVCECLRMRASIS